MTRRLVTRPPGEFVLWAVALAAVWATVDWAPALVVLGLLVGDRLLRPDEHVLATAAVVLIVAVPVVWFLGSTLPLSPPSARLNDNVLAHQVGGLAVWTLFLAACAEVFSRESDSA